MKAATILVNWNSWEDTVACLRSLETLDYPQTTLVIDNGSTNDSASRIGEACPWAQVIELGANRGFGGGCNVGIRRVLSMQAEYIWLLNNDAVAAPEALRALVERMECDGRIGAASSVICDMERRERVQVWGGLRVHMLRGVVSPYKRSMPDERLDFVTGASCLLRADAIRSVGLFDEGFFMYWEDADLGFRLRRGGWKLAVAEKSRVWHKGCGSLGRRNAKADTWNNMSAARFFRRYSAVPAIPLAVGGAYRIARRLALLDFERVAAVARGLRLGVSQDAAELQIAGEPLSGLGAR
jgi:GT2 family glycosyltransferase